MFHMNFARVVTLAVLMLFIWACAPNSSVPLPSVTTEPAPTFIPTTDSVQPLLKTEMGDLAIGAARLVDEANGVKPQAGEKLLLVSLTHPDLANLDPSTFSLEDFNTMFHDPGMELYILGNDGSKTISTMAGWVGDEFSVGFKVPVDINTYTLHWTGNSPIPLRVEE
jgi:hypothetical protein